MTPDNWRWKTEELVPGQAVVFDIDGVLSDATGRQHHIKGGKHDWPAFFDAVGEDSLIDEMALLLSMLESGLQVILLTGRPMRVQPQTLAWLERFDLQWDLLVMRDYGDYAKAREFKEKTVSQLREAGFKLLLAFEDDKHNAEMFRKNDVPCVYIHSGYYD